MKCALLGLIIVLLPIIFRIFHLKFQEIIPYILSTCYTCYVYCSNQLLMKYNRNSTLKQKEFITDPYNFIIKDIVREDLPVYYDSRQAYPYCESLKGIRDQANCGSCWAFAVAEVISDRICIFSKGYKQPRISPLHFMTCCSTCIFEEKNSCLGGFLQGGFAYWESNGVPTGGSYNDKTTCKPYTLPPCDHYSSSLKYGPCSFNLNEPAQCDYFCQPEYPKPFDSDLYFALSVYQIANTEKAIMTEIYENGPVAGYYQLYEDFYSYKNGIYIHQRGSNTGGHAIKIIGWGIENGVKYWIVANSWNENWGEDGFFRILRGINHCGIEEQIVSGIPKIQ